MEPTLCISWHTNLIVPHGIAIEGDGLLHNKSAGQPTWPASILCFATNSAGVWLPDCDLPRHEIRKLEICGVNPNPLAITLGKTNDTNRGTIGLVLSSTSLTPWGNDVVLSEVGIVGWRICIGSGGTVASTWSHVQMCGHVGYMCLGETNNTTLAGYLPWLTNFNNLMISYFTNQNGIARGDIINFEEPTIGGADDMVGYVALGSKGMNMINQSDAQYAKYGIFGNGTAVNVIGGDSEDQGYAVNAPAFSTLNSTPVQSFVTVIGSGAIVNFLGANFQNSVLSEGPGGTALTNFCFCDNYGPSSWIGSVMGGGIVISAPTFFNDPNPVVYYSPYVEFQVPSFDTFVGDMVDGYGAKLVWPSGSQPEAPNGFQFVYGMGSYWPTALPQVYYQKLGTFEVQPMEQYGSQADYPIVYKSLNGPWSINQGNHGGPTSNGVARILDSDFISTGWLSANGSGYGFSLPEHYTVGRDNVGQLIIASNGVPVVSITTNGITLSMGTFTGNGSGLNNNNGALSTLSANSLVSSNQAALIAGLNSGVTASNVAAAGAMMLSANNAVSGGFSGGYYGNYVFQSGALSGIMSGGIHSNATYYGTFNGNGAGVYYPSNTWSLAATTNGMNSGDFKLANSNGIPVVVGMSNGTPYVNYISTTSGGIIP